MGLHAFSRTEMLIGEENLNKLSSMKVAVVGIGGVGTFSAEALARAGVGKLVLIDDDDICLTNINRQLHALRSTVGKAKVDVMKERIKDINPAAEIITYKKLYNSESSDEILDESPDYVIDAIDMISSKLDLVEKCYRRNIPLISCMGAGNKLDPTKFEVADIYETTICPVARVMRKELRKRDIGSLKVIYSREKPMSMQINDTECRTDCICTNRDRTCTDKRSIPGSVSFVPSVAGLIIAAEVINDLIFGDQFN